ncbi:hypothetical protein MIMGU_mgv1a007507mg [Erythranthe guttata]|uniref:Cytochrome P450 n=1 Tax=Erythranthe guttata TaxID=4155 RepID=A0A022R2Q9_ERYGU|nr:hypothetical protein MIMGU_mgv1a007507mg [Erythranthe guttata]
MELYPIYATFLLLIIPTLVFLLLKRNNSMQKRLPLPPGSLGLPIIGQSLQIFRAMRANRGEDWIRERIRKYGAVSKLNVFGSRSVLLHGPAANKFIYTCDEKVLSNQQPASVRRLMGERNLLELNGEDHKRVRGAMLSFLKPEALRQSVGRMDQEIRFHLKHHWHGKHEILVMPLMKTLTFNVICSLIFGIERGIRRERLVYLFELLIDGMLALPINLPFTRFSRSLRARSEIGDIILELIREKRQQMEKQETLDNHQDLITRFLSMTDDDVANPSPLLSDEEIVDNCSIILFCTKQVFWTAFMTHMDESIYPDPSTFNPARFDNQGATPPYSFMAFGGGPRMCPGYEFARIETLTMVHYLVTRFRWKLSLEENLFGRAPLPFFHQGLPIQVKFKKPLDDDDVIM